MFSNVRSAVTQVANNATVKNVAAGLDTAPQNSKIEKLGNAGEFMGRKVASTYAPEFIARAVVRTVQNVVGNIGIGGIIGMAAAPMIVPALTPIAIYATGIAFGGALTVVGNVAKNLLCTKDKTEKQFVPAEKKEISDKTDEAFATVAEINKVGFAKTYGKLAYQTYAPGIIAYGTRQGAAKLMGHAGLFVGGSVAPFIVPVVSPVIATAGSMAIDYIGNKYFSQTKNEKPIQMQEIDEEEADVTID